MDTIENTESKKYRIPVYKVTLVKEGTHSQLERPQVKDAKGAAETLAAYLAGEDREHFVVMLLNGKNRIIGINTVSIGSLSSSLAHPREVLKPAILCNAAAIIVAHNHPSGQLTPSPEDLDVTHRLKVAGDILGVEVLDHVLLAGGKWYSFAEHENL